jgi:hypothetical protein
MKKDDVANLYAQLRGTLRFAFVRDKSWRLRLRKIVFFAVFFLLITSAVFEQMQLQEKLFLAKSWSYFSH